MSVLAWHAIGGEGPASVPVDRFRRQLDLLSRAGRTVVPLRAARGGRRGAVALTFDDGHLETWSTAFPMLAERGWVATVYVATDWISSGRWFEPRGRGMTWEMVAELGRSGWTVGSHSRSHARLTSLSDAALREELAGSRAVVEDRLGGPCHDFCAPYGDLDGRVLEAARAAGYRTTAVSAPARHPLPPGAPDLVWRSGIYGTTPLWVFRLKARGLDPRLPPSAWPWPGRAGAV